MAAACAARHRGDLGAVGAGDDPALPEVSGWAHFIHLPVGQVAVQALLQGDMQGAIGIVAYTHTIRVLGVSRAVLFPASVPAVSILIGIPVLGKFHHDAGWRRGHGHAGLTYAVGVSDAGGFHRSVGRQSAGGCVAEGMTLTKAPKASLDVSHVSAIGHGSCNKEAGQ